MHCSCSLYIYESFSLVLILWEFFAPSTLYSANCVRNKRLFLHSDGVKVSGLVTFQVFISSRCWNWYYLAVMLFFQRYKLCSYQHCDQALSSTKTWDVSPRGNLIISPKGCSAIYLAVRTVVLSGAATKRGRLSPFSSHALQCCKAFLRNTDSCGQGGLSCIKW